MITFIMFDTIPSFLQHQWTPHAQTMEPHFSLFPEQQQHCVKTFLEYHPEILHLIITTRNSTLKALHLKWIWCINDMNINMNFNYKYQILPVSKFLPKICDSDPKRSSSDKSDSYTLLFAWICGVLCSKGYVACKLAMCNLCNSITCACIL